MVLTKRTRHGGQRRTEQENEKIYVQGVGTEKKDREKPDHKYQRVERKG